MGKEQMMRFRGAVAWVLMAGGGAGLLGGCNILPDDGYEKVAYRVRDPLPAAAAPAPPPMIPGFGAGGAQAVPQLTADVPAGVTQEMVDEGARQFGTVCSVCHGAGGVGTPAGPALADGAWLHISGSFEEIAGIIQSGVANPVEFPAAMPPLGGGSFNEEQVRQLAAYVFALSHQEQ
jgi:mono/diheme cytochrome c family protein